MGVAAAREVKSGVPAADGDDAQVRLPVVADLAASGGRRRTAQRGHRRRAERGGASEPGKMGASKKNIEATSDAG